LSYLLTFSSVGPMSKNRFELHTERLGTTDEKGHRVYLFPEDVKGVWRYRRTFFYWFLIFIYMVLPWIHIDGKQIILLNIPQREFSFLHFTFYAHDAPIFLLFLLGFVFSMGFITSIWGRAWCGWGCPQTVFIDAIFRPIERLIEGRARQRQNLLESPWNFEKIWKKTLKWFLYTVISIHISHSLLGYFVGTRELFWITLSPPKEHFTLFLFMISITATFLFDFGWFREQFCIIACPYGRIQSVMMDQDSLAVAYDVKRGEPRRSQEVTPEGEGDCINCFHCVKVCPTGIDIRRGIQMECIACTNCIDACDEIMDKLGKPKGLIRYDSENGLQGIKSKKINFRSIVYLSAILIICVVSVFAIKGSKKLELTFLRASKTPFVKTKLKDGRKGYANLYKVRVDYKGEKNLSLVFKAKNLESQKNIEIITPKSPLIVKKGSSFNAIIHFRFSEGFLKGHHILPLLVINEGERDENNQFPVILEKEVTLVGPLN
jgi:cytochrome c oxidase accessory protein FixG